MANSVEGLDLRYTARTSWKAEVARRGAVLGVVPVTWVSGRDGRLQEVWFANPIELREHLENREPFVVAVAEEKLPRKGDRPQFLRFNALFRVVSTGKQLSPTSIETEVISRVTAETWPNTSPAP